MITTFKIYESFLSKKIKADDEFVRNLIIQMTPEYDIKDMVRTEGEDNGGWIRYQYNFNGHDIIIKKLTQPCNWILDERKCERRYVLWIDREIFDNTEKELQKLWSFMGKDQLKKDIMIKKEKEPDIEV